MAPTGPDADARDVALTQRLPFRRADTAATRTGGVVPEARGGVLPEGRAPAMPGRRVGTLPAERAAPSRLRGAAGRVEALTAAGLLMAFAATLFIPLNIEVAGLRLSPLRLFLLVAFLPLLLRLLMGRAGPLRAIDLLLVLHCVWVFVTLTMAHGTARIPLAGITAVEIFGGYLVGRTLVLNAVDYRALIRYVMIGLAVVLPFALLEFLTDRQPLREIAASIGTSFEKGESSRPRMGLHRVMAVFEHPILFGMFCTILLAPVLYLWRGRMRPVAAATLAAMAFMSLSSAPLIAVALQVALVAWDRITGGRWLLLVLLMATAYVAVDLVSNRAPLNVFLHYLTFDSHTGWTRVAIWDNGVAAVRQQPIFGWGLNEFPRPVWLTDSVDNFWLLIAIRHGLVGLACLVLGLAMGALAVLRAQNLSDEARLIRTAHMVSLAGLCFMLSTVHVWGATSSFILCMIGASMWLATPRAQAQGGAGPVAERGGPPTLRRQPSAAGAGPQVATVLSGGDEGRPRRPGAFARRQDGAGGTVGPEPGGGAAPAGP